MGAAELERLDKELAQIVCTGLMDADFKVEVHKAHTPDVDRVSRLFGGLTDRVARAGLELYVSLPDTQCEARNCVCHTYARR